MKTADPNDPRMIDIAGFDATVPSIINKFILDECWHRPLCSYNKVQQTCHIILVQDGFVDNK